MFVVMSDGKLILYFFFFLRRSLVEHEKRLVQLHESYLLVLCYHCISPILLCSVGLQVVFPADREMNQKSAKNANRRNRTTRNSLITHNIQSTSLKTN